MSAQIQKMNQYWLEGVVAVVIGVISSFLIYVYRTYCCFKKIKGIPHFDGYAIFGMAYTLPDAHEFRLKMIQDKGPVNQFHFFGQHFLMVNEGRLAKIVMETVKGKGVFHKGGISADNIFSLDTNAAWKSRRQAFRHAFTTTSLKHYEKGMNNLLDKLCAILDKHAREKTVLPIDDLFAKFTLDVIYTVGFELEKNFMENDKEYQELNESVQLFFKNAWAAFLPFSSILSPLGIIPQLNTWHRTMKIINKFQMEVLNNMREKYKKQLLAEGSFAKILMEFAEHEHLTEEEILSELLIFMLAGHETTAHTLSFLVYSLAKHSAVQKQCQEIAKTEICDTSHSTESENEHHTITPTFSAFKLLPDYLEAVIKETMRKYVVSSRGIVRQVHDEGGIDLPIGLANGDHVEKGTWIMVSFYALHNDTNNWGEDAREYKPERWLQQPSQSQRSSSSSSSTNSSTSSPTTVTSLNSPAAFAGIGFQTDSTIFAPFSSGVRNCIGMNMALWEIRAVFARLISRYEFELADEDLHDEKKALLTDITMKPLNQLPVFVKFL